MAIDLTNVIDCPKCGVTHLATTKCTSKPTPAQEKILKAAVASEVDPFQKFKEWEEGSKKNPTTYRPSTKTCPKCGKGTLLAKNFLGIEFLVMDDAERENFDIHYPDCRAQARAAEITAIPDLTPPRRPYKDD